MHVMTENPVNAKGSQEALERGEWGPGPGGSGAGQGTLASEGQERISWAFTRSPRTTLTGRP